MALGRDAASGTEGDTYDQGESRRAVKRRKLSPDGGSSQSRPPIDTNTSTAFGARETGSPPATSSSQWRNYPSEQKTHRCTHENCNKSFNRPARLAEHVRSHNNDRPFKCNAPGCDKDFIREAHLTHHVKSAHTAIRDHACTFEDCGKRFLTATRLRRHEAAHQGRDKYRCRDHPPCNETFRKHSTLQRHVTSVHLNQKPFPCTHIDPSTMKQCVQAFDTAGRLRSHEGRVHGGLRFWCIECLPNTTTSSTTNDINPDNDVEGVASGVGFSTYSLLQDHLRDAHPPTCAECSLSCSSQRELRGHIELAHSNVELPSRQTHACDEPGCGRAFTKPFNLTVHKRSVHENQKPFVCNETIITSTSDTTASSNCGRAFKTKASLQSHIRTAHLHEPNPRRRTQNPAAPSTTAITHPSSTLTHLTGANYADATARPLSCPMPDCLFRFSRAYDIEGHLRARHGVADAEMADVRSGRYNDVQRSYQVDFDKEGDDEEVDDDDDDDDAAWQEAEDAFDRFLQLDNKNNEKDTRHSLGKEVMRGGEENNDDEDDAKNDDEQFPIDPALLKSTGTSLYV
ncbi:MAG: hypothetical protein M1825_001243 [Sarcosagium campestre]|nr:MAG: hypothetical protein M1825_001243 [Sarcosagium campestre]